MSLPGRPNPTLTKTRLDFIGKRLSDDQIRHNTCIYVPKTAVMDPRLSVRRPKIGKIVDGTVSQVAYPHVVDKSQDIPNLRYQESLIVF